MLRSIFSKPYSHVFIIGDNVDWAIDEEARSLVQTILKLGLKPVLTKHARLNLPQFVHYTSQFALLDKRIYKSRHRISLDYFHGKGEQSESLRKCFEALKKHHSQLFRIRVSTKEMEAYIKSSGIDPKKVVRIPIGINLEIFTTQTEEKKQLMREKLGIPRDTLVIGSFQKDGIGWENGDEPKLIKGPDTFLKVVEKLKQSYPNIFILLTGPARGYVKNGLKKLGIPYKHDYLKKYSELNSYYDALDLYLITSREEGGPKACLEAMAKKIPLITTRVGQCQDLVKTGENAMMAPIDAVDELVQSALAIIPDKELRNKLVENGRKTAQENSLEKQLLLWKEFFEKLIIF